MLRTRLCGTAALALLVAAAGCDRSGEIGADGGPAGAQEMVSQQELDAEMMGHIAEIQEIQQRLEPVQNEAMQDEALAAQLSAIQLQVETAMRNEDADFFDRLERLQDDVAAAQAAGDAERIQSLMAQAQGIEQQGQALQAAVYERPEIRAPIEAFEAAHRARMIEIDPEAGPLLDRVEELIALLPH